MVAIAHHPANRERPLGAELSLAARGAAARTLARGYLRYVSAVWRGDEAAGNFAAWLDQFWADSLPPVPGRVPDAISPHGGGGHGISWYETSDEVLGTVPGIAGGYRVPIAALERMPPLPAAGAVSVLRHRPCGRVNDQAGLGFGGER